MVPPLNTISSHRPPWTANKNKSLGSSINLHLFQTFFGAIIPNKSFLSPNFKKQHCGICESKISNCVLAKRSERHGPSYSYHLHSCTEVSNQPSLPDVANINGSSAWSISMVEPPTHLMGNDFTTACQYEQSVDVYIE